MKLIKAMMMAGVAVLLSTHAFAATAATAVTAKDAPDGSEVIVSGTVENFDSRHPFTLRDDSGSVSVDLSSAKPIVLKNGQKVTITGVIDKDLFGTNIDASSVQMSAAEAASTPPTAELAVRPY